jgi:hypothetical protein
MTVPNPTDYNTKKPWLAGARAQDTAIVLAALLGAAVGYWAVRSGRVLGAESNVLLATGQAATGLLALTLAAMTIVLGFLDDYFGRVVDRIGLGKFFQPFRLLATCPGNNGWRYG